MKKTIWITILLLVGGAPGAFAQLSLRTAIGYDELGQVALGFPAKIFLVDCLTPAMY